MATITSPYGPRIHPTSGKPSFHHGVDYRAPVGTPIYANQNMTVTRVGYEPGYGKYIYAKDANGNEHRYGHLDNQNVKVGDAVKPGDKLGNTGNTGDSTGPHLHYEVRKPDGKSVDPQSIDPATGKPYSDSSGFQKGKTFSGSDATKDPDYKPGEQEQKPTTPPVVPPVTPPGEGAPGRNPGDIDVIGKTTPAMNEFFGNFGHQVNPRLGASDLRETRVPR